MWPHLVEAFSDFGRWQHRTDREIPVVILRPR
ncbi:hypothetical protein [Streptomyces sp. ID05-04B]|nr:hypothetical protein [Streptomyces sp. ID05-04B]